MDGTIVNVKPFAVHDGPGIRTTLFLKGCPLRCFWCHNPESQRREFQRAWFSHKCTKCNHCNLVCPCGLDPRKIEVVCTACGRCEQACPHKALRIYGKRVSVKEILPKLLEDRIFFESSGGGVTISGGEPLDQTAFSFELLSELKANGIHTAVDTCGAVPWDSFEKVLPVTDLFLYDVKHIDSTTHRSATGMGNERILENLRCLSIAGKSIRIRIPIIAGFNDSKETFVRIAEELSPLNIEGVELLSGHDLARSRYAALGMEYKIPGEITPTKDVLSLAKGIFEREGITVIV